MTLKHKPHTGFSGRKRFNTEINRHFWPFLTHGTVARTSELITRGMIRRSRSNEEKKLFEIVRNKVSKYEMKLLAIEQGGKKLLVGHKNVAHSLYFHAMTKIKSINWISTSRSEFKVRFWLAIFMRWFLWGGFFSYCRAGMEMYPTLLSDTFHGLPFPDVVAYVHIGFQCRFSSSIYKTVKAIDFPYLPK